MNKYAPAIVMVSRLIVGAVLIWASLDKIADPATFARDIANYGIPTLKLENLLAMILPWTELLVGIALIAGIMVDGAAVISALMMLVFIFAIGQAILRGIDIECGCGMKAGQMVGLPKLLEDFVYFLMSLLIWFRPEKRYEIWPN